MSKKLGTDIYTLRRELLKRLDAHPLEVWSEPLLMSFIGILDAHALAAQMGTGCGQHLRIV